MSYNTEQFKKDKENLDLLKGIEEGNKILSNFKRKDAIDFIQKQKSQNKETNINTQFILYSEANDDMLKIKICDIIDILKTKFILKVGE